jgi:pyruvate/2-oxoglutarate dehydrogenase complex dihydrolipoamide acyltransferase (E2) component
MSYTFTLPDLGEGVAEGEIAAWLVEVGQEVAEDDPLVEIETDKTTVEIPSPVAGVVSAILVPAGSVVPIGTALIEIGGNGAAAPPAAAPAPPVGRVQATPFVRRLAEELGVRLDAVAGSGPDGRVDEQDVRRAAAAPAGAGTPERARREPMSRLRRTIAENLSRSQHEVPAVTVVEECDFTALRTGTRPLVPAILRAVVSGLQAFPELNATLDGTDVLLWERYDIGLAVQTDRGLVVPVVRDADAQDEAALDAQVRDLAEAARAGTLRPDQLRGSTFSVTSAGRLGGLFATPLVNHPEVAILGVHRIAERPVVRDGEVVVRQVGLVSCTFDHRVVDGARASAFLLHVIGVLEDG